MICNIVLFDFSKLQQALLLEILFSLWLYIFYIIFCQLALDCFTSWQLLYFPNGTFRSFLGFRLNRLWERYKMHSKADLNSQHSMANYNRSWQYLPSNKSGSHYSQILVWDVLYIYFFLWPPIRKDSCCFSSDLWVYQSWCSVAGKDANYLVYHDLLGLTSLRLIETETGLDKKDGLPIWLSAQFTDRLTDRLKSDIWRNCQRSARCQCRQLVMETGIF